MTNDPTVPFPEAQQKQEDNYLKNEYQKLLEREQAEAEAAQNAKLDAINRDGDISELKTNLRLRCSFVDKYGWERWGELNRKHLAQQRKQRVEAELAEKQTKRSISTSQGRIALLNKSRKAR